MSLVRAIVRIKLQNWSFPAYSQCSGRKRQSNRLSRSLTTREWVACIDLSTHHLSQWRHLPSVVIV